MPSAPNHSGSPTSDHDVGLGSVGPEVSLFIVWARARSDEGRILEEIRSRFEIAGTYDVQWSAPLISRNFARFYRGRPLPPYRTSLEHQKGRGPFLAVVVVDRSPRYGQRETAGGWRWVNTNVFDTKELIRRWAVGSYTVHSADTSHTAARELVLLFDRDPQTWLDNEVRDRRDRVKVCRQDPIATTGWRSLRHLYDALGRCTRYVDLDGGHGPDSDLPIGAPIRLLTSEYKEVLSILAAEPVGGYLSTWGGLFSVRIGDDDVAIEVRSDSDGYVDRSWADEILDHRVLRSNGAYTPRDADLFEASLYHMLVHQPSVSAEDLTRLRSLCFRTEEPIPEALVDRSDFEALLRAVMADRSHRFTRPRDVGVYYNHRLAGSPRPAMRTVKDAVVRRSEWIYGTAVLAPLRRLVLGTRERLLLRVPSIRSIEGALRRRRPRLRRRKRHVSGRGG